MKPAIDVRAGALVAATVAATLLTATLCPSRGRRSTATGGVRPCTVSRARRRLSSSGMRNRPSQAALRGSEPAGRRPVPQLKLFTID